jgi:hypothetical protein
VDTNLVGYEVNVVVEGRESTSKSSRLTLDRRVSGPLALPENSELFLDEHMRSDREKWRETHLEPADHGLFIGHVLVLDSLESTRGRVRWPQAINGTSGRQWRTRRDAPSLKKSYIDN